MALCKPFQALAPHYFHTAWAGRIVDRNWLPTPYASGPGLVYLAFDYCDGLVDESSYDRGFVVWRNRGIPAEEYVFRTRGDAQRWQQACKLDEFPILEVLAPVPFHWRTSTGSLRDLEMADALVKIWPDHRFPPGPNRAFLST